MKWFLVIMLLNGGVTSIPMDSHRACVAAAFKVSETMIPYPTYGRTVCISQGE